MKPLIITDIDGTILDSEKRRYQSLVELLGTIPAQEMKAYDLPGLTDEQRTSFFQIFHSGKYTYLDRPLKNAAETLNWAVSKGIAIAYITGRPSLEGRNMLPSTMDWLKTHEFPIPDQETVHLFLKEVDGPKDEFLKECLPKARALGFPICGIGDTPEDACSYISDSLPALILNTHQFPENKFPRGTLRMKNWETIKDWIQKNG